MKNRFKSFITSKLLCCILGSLITILVISCYTFVTSYNKTLDRTLATHVIYKNEYIETFLSADLYGYLDSSHGNKKLYFGVLPAKDTAIEIIIPSRARLYVYSSDENSILVRYEPFKGIKRNYKISGYGNFDKVLNAFYELTGNGIFKPIT